MNDAEGNVLAIYDNDGTSMQQKEVPVYAAGRIGMYRKASGTYQYELTDHLGNVRAVVAQNKTAGGLADVVYYSDYYPYGSPLTLANNDYRYGYQGQYAETDKESAWVNFALRMYDPVVGRWMTTDPYGQYHSPYVGMGNDPVNGVDSDGGWWKWLAATFRQISVWRGQDPSPLNQSGKEWGYNTGYTASDGAVGITGHYGGYFKSSSWFAAPSWLNPRKDASIGSGISMYAHLGYPHQGEDNRFMPNARNGVTDLGDMTPFLMFMGQINPTSSRYNPFNYTSALDNMESSIKPIIKNFQSKPTLAPQEARNVVDPIKFDTITTSEALHRMKLRGGENWNGWTQLNYDANNR